MQLQGFPIHFIRSHELKLIMSLTHHIFIFVQALTPNTEPSCTFTQNKQIRNLNPLNAATIYMFRAIREFAQSRDCVTHSQNLEIAQAISGLCNMCAQSRDCITRVHNLKIAHVPVRPTAKLCSSQEDILDKRRLPP